MRLILLFLASTTCLTASFLVYDRWQTAQLGRVIAVEGGSPNLTAAEQLYLQTYLAGQADNLNRPAGRTTESVTFVVSTGERADQIAANLRAAGLINDTTLFLNYVRFYGLDDSLEAGTFELAPGLSVPELAVALTQSRAQDVELRFLEGWRSEEMANYLNTVQAAAIDGQTFLAIVTRQQPFDLGPYDFLASLPAGATLEGYLFPDTYRVPADADAAFLVNLMLTTFGERVTPAMRQAFGAQGLSVREAVILATVVERETPRPAERPIVAGVFLNRLNQGMKLEADPTIQYALGYQPAADTWWKNPLTAEDLGLDSPYNTYLYEGLPPGPIANPGLAALEAVAAPATTEFIFFVADCTPGNEGGHLFSVTYDEHLANVQNCR